MYNASKNQFPAELAEAKAQLMTLTTKKLVLSDNFCTIEVDPSKRLKKLSAAENDCKACGESVLFCC